MSRDLSTPNDATCRAITIGMDILYFVAIAPFALVLILVLIDAGRFDRLNTGLILSGSAGFLGIVLRVFGAPEVAVAGGAGAAAIGSLLSILRR